MGNNGDNQNGILAKLGAILKVLLGNRTIALLGLLVAILTLIVTVALKEVRIFIGLDQPAVSQSERPTEPEPSPPIMDSKAPATPSEYAINEHQPQFVKEAQTGLSVTFRNVYGEDFVSLNISPKGFQSSVRAILSGYTEEFESPTGVYNVQVSDVDYENKRVVVLVSRSRLLSEP